jgi:hypothetical protein
MILIDMNQVMISNLMVQVKNTKDINENIVRSITLYSLRSYKNKFSEYGEMILCYDSKNYWRKKYFPHYKSTRKRDREKSDLNWTSIFELLNKIRDEISENLPYRILNVDGSEADDSIAVMCHEQALINIRLQRDMQPTKKTIILSGDKDFIQLQKYSFVTQFNPVTKKYVTGMDPKKFTIEHIIKGDRSDSIPNIFSDDDTFVAKKRQRPISKKFLDNLLSKDIETSLTKEQLNNYVRNRTLIDLDYIPEEVKSSILDAYYNAKMSSRSKILNYLIQNNLQEHIMHLQEF